jgi:hypothetical protein
VQILVEVSDLSLSVRLMYACRCLSLVVEGGVGS